AVRANLDLESVHDDRLLGRRRLGAGAFRGFHGRLGDELFPEQARGVRVVVDREHHLAGVRVQASSSTDHLVEADGRVDVPDEGDVAHAGHIHAGGEEIDRAGDEVAGAGAAQVGELVVSAGGGGALEGV